MLTSHTAPHLPKGPGLGDRRMSPIEATVQTQQGKWEICEIKDVEGIRACEGYVRCHWFQAYATGPRGSYVVAESSGFYCPEFMPEAEYARTQHATLVAQLITDGWKPTGECGQGWWSLTFRRAI